MTPTNPELRQFIMQYFSDEELEILCFDYFPEAGADFGSGMGKSRKVIVLIGHCERRGRLDDLRAALSRERADAWNQRFNARPAEETFQPNVSTPTIRRDPRQIFLSHATADAEFAHALAADLLAKGWPVWIAPESIRAGEKWVEAINRGLETSGVFLVALTPDAVASRWVNTETDAAVEMQHEGLIAFIPLDVFACQPKRLWRQYQYIRFRDSYAAGLDALLSLLDARTNTDDYVDGLKALPDKVFPPKITKGPPPKPDHRIHEKTGIELIRIPAGPFLYGSADSDKLALDNEESQRMIDLPEYWIGRYLITNAQYKRFVDATNHRTPSHWKNKVPSQKKLEHPVVNVSWDDAKAFCDWAGLAMPTEEQWEKAARGTDGRIWPWGDDTPTDNHCNFGSNVGDTTAVGSYSPLGDSPYGCVDMAGNVLEWTGVWYEEGSPRALRGGSWYSIDQNARAAYRVNVNPYLRDSNVGFRVVELLSNLASRFLISHLWP